MTNRYTTDYLLENMKLRGFIPQASGLTSTQALEILTQELQNYITSFLKSIREEYLITTIDIPITSSVIPAPERAVGASFRLVQWINTSGNPIQLPRIEPENAVGFTNTGSTPVGYQFRGNNIVLVPDTFDTGTLRVAYQLRPGTLVPVSACGEITSVGSGSITVSAKPANFTDSESYDFVSGTPNFAPLLLNAPQALNQAGTFSWSGNVLSCPTNYSDAVSIGDFICLATETCIVPLPQELHSLLAQAGAAKIAQAQGSARYPQIMAGLKDLRDQLTTLLSPRSDGSARPVVHRGRIGWGAWGGY